MGTILLADSRAVGKPMDVVLGARAPAALALNPSATISTITARIVSQLTGDQNFNSPEALATFVPGRTFLVDALTLSILAPGVVRRFREQYE